MQSSNEVPSSMKFRMRFNIINVIDMKMFEGS